MVGLVVVRMGVALLVQVDAPVGMRMFGAVDMTTLVSPPAGDGGEGKGHTSFIGGLACSLSLH